MTDADFFLLSYFLQKIVLRFSLFNKKISSPNKKWNYGTIDNFFFHGFFFYS